MKKLTLLTLSLVSLFAVSAYAGEYNETYEEGNTAMEIDASYWNYPVYTCSAKPLNHNRVYQASSNNRYEGQNMAMTQCLSRHRNCMQLGCIRTQ